MASSKLLIVPDPPKPTGMLAGVGGGRPLELSLVLDGLNNKYYSNIGYDQYVAEVKARQANAQSQVDTISRSGAFGLAPPAFNTIGGRVDPYGDAVAYLEQAMSMVVPKKEDFIQSTDVVKSYQAYGADWNNYFEGNYKNPRVAEENRNSRARGLQRNKTREAAFNGMQDLVIENSSMPSSKKSRGTGVASKADTFSGGLEAGLGV